MSVTKHKLACVIDNMCLGTTTMGARGQVVVPVEARKAMRLKQGDKLMVFVKFGKALGFIRTEEMSGFIDSLTKHVNKIKKHK
jgi:AbrB family looped-hinge helix DNA binding protein